MSVTPTGDGLSTERQHLLRLLAKRGAKESRTDRRYSAAHDVGMRISLFFFSANLDDRAADKMALVLECAELADRLGLHAVWVPERHFDPFGAPYPSPAILLAAIAARTQRIGLRAGSVVLPLHDPLLVAEEWGMLDAISGGGRVGLSLASGWHSDDFVLAPGNYDERRAVLQGELGVLTRLWNGEATSRVAPGDRRLDIRTYPQPLGVPPLWLTSSGNPMTWESAGRLGLNVLTALLEQTVEEIGEKVLLYRTARAAAGHSGSDFQITCMLHTHLAADGDTVFERVRPPLTEYLSAHLDLFSKFASSQDLGVRPDDVTAADRQALIDHGFHRYFNTAGLFGDVDSCQPMVSRLVAAGVTELGCLVDFGLRPDQVVACVHELARLQGVLNEAGKVGEVPGPSNKVDSAK